MLKQRIITTVVGMPIVIFTVWFGAPAFSIFVSVVALIGTFEFYHLISASGRGCPLTYFGLLWALVLVLSPHYQNIRISNIGVLPLAITLPLVISLGWLLFRSPRGKALSNWAWTIAGVIYVGWMLSYWINLRLLEDGRNWVYLAMLTTFANDTGAFFIGKKWGKHKMAAAISPGKTWEGAAGGLISAILGAFILVAILNFISPFALKPWQILIIACLISLFAQLGDLAESLLKRNTGAKEAGGFLPGHGGILDRFDSLIFVGAMIYYYVVFAL